MLTEPEPETTDPIDRDELVGEAIEAYLELAEGGSPPDVEEFARGYPDLGDDLVSALEGLALVQGLVGEVNGPGHRLEEGRRVAGYRIVKELGRGGMGIVYEAVHVALDRPVALKVLGSQAAPDSSGRRRFLNEAKTAAGLHHTHIVPVWDVGQVGGLCYYAMQRIEGSGLDRVLRTLRRDRSVAAGSTLGSGFRKTGASPAPKPGPRPGLDGSLATSGLGDETQTWGGLGNVGGGSAVWRRREPVDQSATFVPPRGSGYYRWVADVGQQAADALAHAHQRGVIHRDIKPSNLLVDARGMIWVADFGLARRLADPSQTQFDSMLGTPRYMSPEQAMTGVLDGRADIYSLGATLYELITLRPPFDGQSAAELVEQIKTKEPFRPRKFDARVPLDLETILLKALAKRPDDRYASADALADDLNRFLAHEPVKARRIGPIGRMVRFARRHPSLTAVSTAATALVLTIATIAYVRIARERDRADLAAGDALKAKSETEQKNQELKAESLKARRYALDSFERQGAYLLLSKDTNRRSRGLGNLKLAAELKPDPAFSVKLRDQAVALLSMRDVEERPAIQTRDSTQHGLIFEAEGRKLAGLSDDGDLGIWDVATQKLVAVSAQHLGPSRLRPPNNGRDGRNGGGGGQRRFGSRNVAVGNQIAIIKPDGTGVRFFDPARLEAPVSILEMKGHLINSLYASSDGPILLTLSQPASAYSNRPGPSDRFDRPDRPDFQDETRLTLWDRDRPEGPKATLSLPPIKLDQTFPMTARWMVAIAPDGSKIAACRMSDPEILLWDGEGRPLPPIKVQANTTTLALGPAGLLAVAGLGGEIALWDLSFAEPKHLPSLPLHQSSVNRIRFSPRNGSLLAATGMGGVELWDLSNHTMIADFSTREPVEDLAFSPDGQTLAAAQLSSIAIWSVVEPTGQDVLPETGDRPGGLAFGRDDLLAITSSDGNVPAPLRLWGGPGRCPPLVDAWDQVRPTSVGFDALGRLIAIESDAIRWYQPPSVTPVASIEFPPITFGRPQGGGGGRPPDRKTDGPASPPRMPPALIASRTPDGRTFLINRPNGLFLWRSDAPESLKPLQFPDRESGGRGIILDPSGSRIFQVNMRNEQLRLIARPLVGHEVKAATWSLNVSQVNTLAVSPDGKILAVGDRSGAVLLVDAVLGIAKERLSPLGDEAGPVESLSFAPDRPILAVGGREHVRLWAIDGKPRPLVRLPGHRGAIRSLAFDSKGTRLAGADEKTIKVWDLGSLRSELARLGLDW
jgi:serine/threonine protein kinase/WD40 repeat protein